MTPINSNKESHMAVTKRLTSLPDRKISFAAPDAVHGAIKQIVGWAEMNRLELNGKSFTEKDFINSLVAGFYASGQETWIDKLENNALAFEKLVKPSPKPKALSSAN